MKPSPVSVLGIDPGLNTTGYALIRHETSLGFQLENSGFIKSSSSLSLGDRLNKIYASMAVIAKNVRPDVIAIEGIFYHRNIKSLIQLASARACIILVAAQEHIQVAEYDPLVVKQAVVGYGKASKEQVAFMVKRFVTPYPDPCVHHVTDAIAVAICHLNHSK